MLSPHSSKPLKDCSWPSLYSPRSVPDHHLWIDSATSPHTSREWLDGNWGHWETADCQENLPLIRQAMRRIKHSKTASNISMATFQEFMYIYIYCILLHLQTELSSNFRFLLRCSSHFCWPTLAKKHVLTTHARAVRKSSINKTSLHWTNRNIEKHCSSKALLPPAPWCNPWKSQDPNFSSYPCAWQSLSDLVAPQLQKLSDWWLALKGC